MKIDMFREINDGDRTGYADKDGKRVGTINVNGWHRHKTPDRINIIL